MSKTKLTDDEKFKIVDKIFDLKLAIKQAEMDRDWNLRQKLLEDLEQTRKLIEGVKNG